MLDHILLGIIQGLTELLPISSSGHLVLVGHALGDTAVAERMVLEVVVLHLGTLLAVVWALRAELAGMLRGLAGADEGGRRLLGRLVIATLPVVVLGPFLKSPVRDAFDSQRFAAGMLLVTGVILLATRYAPRLTHGARWQDALGMGGAQVAALLPGISRSGITIAAGFARGVERIEAARFSFLMSIPAILGAAVFEATDLDAAAWRQQDVAGLAAGFVAAFAAGLVAIALLLRLVGRRRFEWFGVYCLIAGGVSLWLLRGGA